MTITWSRIIAPSGYRLQDVGILPTLCTSKLRGRLDQLEDGLRRGRADTAGLMRPMTESLTNGGGSTEQIRAACPSEKTPKDMDLAVARMLLRDHALYARTLELSGTELAVR